MSTKIALFDTTLRDGCQGEKINLSLEDKLRIARRLDELGFDYIEGGWPGSNPKDAAFFEQARRETWEHARIVAFGSTARPGGPVARDANLNALLAAETDAISIFGKSWLLHVRDGLQITPEQNRELIYESVRFLKVHGREVIYDAEHFFDGYKDDPDYALSTLQAAAEAGADVIVLCDTNGGTLPWEIAQITADVREVIHRPLGIHAHNDGELAVANSLAAVEAGAVHVQGTINGYGERCGNANLISVIANLQLKLGYRCLPPAHLAKLTELAAFVADVANVAPRDEAAFVGKSAFAHKGGVHVSAVMRNPAMYEHIQPETVGNTRRVLLSELSGRSNVRYKIAERKLTRLNERQTAAIVQAVKELEMRGYSFEAAEASFDLLVQRHRRNMPVYFELSGFRIAVEKDGLHAPRSEASIRVRVDGRLEHTAAEGNGPVNALDNALRKALMRFYPQLALMRLVDYKVRVLSNGTGTAARVRVLIESQAGEERWTTIGVSENIIEASWEALVDSFTYFLMHHPLPQTQDSEVENHVKANSHF